MYGCDGEAWDNNNNKYQKNIEALRDGDLDDGGVIVDSYQINWGGGGVIMYGYLFHGGYIMDVSRFYFDWFYGVNLIYGYQYLIYRPLVYGYIVHGNLVNNGNFDSNSSSKLHPYQL